MTEIKNQPRAYLLRCDDETEAYRPVCDPDSGLPDPMTCDFQKLSLAQIHFIELCMDNMRRRHNQMFLDSGRPDLVKQELYRLYPDVEQSLISSLPDATSLGSPACSSTPAT